MKYRSEIDGLRAFAVVAVIVNHFNAAVLPSGYLGVDVFFVLSGYVITASLNERETGRLPELLTGFYARRVKRLLPALILFVLGTGLLISLVNPSPGNTLKTGLTALFGLSNFYLMRQGSDYFGDAAQLNAFTHTWSLGVEEQFYVLFPFIVWLTGFGAPHKSRAWLFLALMGLLCAASLAAFVYLPGKMGEMAYYLMPARFWELGAGSFAFWLTQRPHPSAAVAKVLDLLRLACMPLACAVFFLPSGHGIPATLAIALLTVLLIWLAQAGTLPQRILSSGPLAYIGLISYSLYLWHWTVLVLSRWTVGIHWWTVPVQVALMLALAMASYRYVERPLRQASWSTRQWPVVAYGVAATAVAAALLLPWIDRLEGRLYMGQRPPLVATGTASLQDDHKVGDTTWRASQCVLGSNKDVGKIITPQGCVLGDFERARTRVLVIGNSQSASFVQAFDTLVKEDGYAVVITSSWGASAVKEIPNSSAWHEASDYYWSHAVPALVATLKPGDWVLLLNELTGFAPPVVTEGHDRVLRLLYAGIARLSDDLAQRGVKLAVLHGLPFMRDANCDPAAGMPQWFARSGGPCKLMGKQASLQQRIPLDSVMVGLASKQKITLIDLFDLFCPGDTCDHRGPQGAFMYRDVWAHPSVEAARLAAPFFRAALKTAEPNVHATAPGPTRNSTEEAFQ